MTTYVVLAAILVVLILIKTVYVYKQGKPFTCVGPVSGAEVIVSVIFFVVMSVVFAYCTGVLTSGYHLIDDHELLDIETMIRTRGFSTALARQFLGDMYGRFRPFYSLVRVIQTFFFADNFLLWHIFYALLSGICMSLMYVYLRLSGAPAWLSYTGAVSVYIGGGQSAAMWRLGPQEGFGLLLLLCTLLLLRNYHIRNTKGAFVACIISTFLLGWTKETFLVIIPLLPVFLIISDIDLLEGIDRRGILSLIRKNIVYIICACLIFIGDVCWILFRVNYRYVNDEYLGEVARSFGPINYIRGIGASLLRGFLPYFVITILTNLLFIYLLRSWFRDDHNDLFFRYLFRILLMDALIGSQVIMYCKIHMTERYLIPSTVFVAILWIIYARDALNDHLAGEGEEKKLPAGQMYLILSVAFALLLFGMRYDTEHVSYLYPGCDDQAMAVNYAANGQSIESALKTVVELSGAESGKILLCMDPESERSSMTYLQVKYDMPGVTGVSQYEDLSEVPVSIPDIPVILGTEEKIDEVYEEMGESYSEYDQIRYGDYLILYREGE